MILAVLRYMALVFWAPFLRWLGDEFLAFFTDEP